MKKRGVLELILSGLIFMSCNINRSTTETTDEQADNLQQIAEMKKEADPLKDKEEVQNLIKRALKWADSKDVIDILPMLTDSEETVYIGFDLDQHKSNLDKLRATDFFSNEFIENYNQIILTLNQMMKNHEFEEWLVGDLPVFGFVNGTNPWCNCQDIPYDNPGPWDYIEVEVIELNEDKGQFIWKWGGMDLNMDADWKEFSYNFRTVKENGKWQISFLQEFDFKKSTRK